VLPQFTFAAAVAAIVNGGCRREKERQSLMIGQRWPAEIRPTFCLIVAGKTVAGGGCKPRRVNKHGGGGVHVSAYKDNKFILLVYYATSAKIDAFCK
jgi:hypothetical protein